MIFHTEFALKSQSVKKRSRGSWKGK